MIILFRVVTVSALVVALLWLYKDPKFDSVFATAIALAAVISLFIVPKLKNKRPNQSQRIKDGSVGIQAGGDVNMGNIGTIQEAKDAE